jgi:hypothetical protein
MIHFGVAKVMMKVVKPCPSSIPIDGTMCVQSSVEPFVTDVRKTKSKGKHPSRKPTCDEAHYRKLR